MKLSVKKTSITIDERSVVNAGEYNVSECEFSFDAAYDGLIKKAVFAEFATKKAKTVAIAVPILDNKCTVPAEVLRAGQYVMVGVYGYKLNQAGKLALRYSPAPARFLVSPGSYRKGTKPLEGMEAEKYDLYDAKIRDALDRVDDLVSDVTDRLENGEFVGATGKDGVPGKSPYIGANGNWFTYDDEGNAVDTYITAGADLSQLALKSELPVLFTDPEWNAMFNINN